MKTKIMFVNQTSRFGGAERVLYDLLRDLDRSRFEPTLVSPRGDLEKAARNLNIPHINVDEFSQMDTTRSKFKGEDLFITYRLYKKINKIIKDVQPSIIYTNSVKAHILVNLKSRSIPTLVRLHDFPQSFKGLSRKLLRFSMKRAKHISCVSECVHQDLSQLLQTGDKEKSSYIYNGFNAPHPVEKHFKKRIVIAGWLLEWKGFEAFVDAMEMIAEEISEWEFVLAGAVAEDALGSAEFSNRLRKKVESSPFRDRFKFSGGYSKLSDVLCCSDHCIFVHASLKPDPLPTVLLEASSLKLPIICSSLGGGEEIIKNGETGFVVYPSPQKIAQHVIQLVKDHETRSSFGNRAYSRVVERFSMENYVHKIQSQILLTSGSN